MKKTTLSRLLAVLMVVLMAVSAVPAASLSVASAAKTSAATAATVKLSKCTFTYDKNQVYTGKARKPAVTVTYGDKTLVKGTDYTVTYKNNKDIGIASMTLTAKSGSGFTGSKTLKFVIRPAKVKGLTSTKQTTTAIRLTWTAVKGATGYRVYRYDAKTGTYVKVKNVTGTAATVKKLTAGTTYRFAVRAYAVAGKKIYWGVYSKALKVKTLPQPSVDPGPQPDTLAQVTGLKAVKNGTTVVLTWNAVANAPAYHVCSYDAATQQYTTLAKTTANKATLTGLTIETPYDIVVRAYAEGADGTTYGEFSAPLTVTVYYADYYSALFKSGTFQATIKTNMEGMTDPITIAAKNGNLYLKTKMPISDSTKATVQILYLNNGKVYLCMSGLWFDATSAMDGDESMLDIVNVFSEIELGDTDHVTVSKETHGQTTYTVEKISNGTNGYTKLYIKDGTLVKLITVDDNAVTTSITFSSISDQVSDKLFKAPKHPLDLSAFGGI
ncbi:MAG: fibronectin type III domain-containing protein [Clostridia bacterium]|nr:fibronectin type III domain-containing protein [Clostridia bacterium]